LYDDATLSFFVVEISGFTKKIANLQWEQVLSNGYENQENCYHTPKGSAKNAVHFCWGNRAKNRLEQSGISDTKTPIVGPIHMDTLHDSFSGFYKSKKEIADQYQLNKDKDWILFISSFTFPNMNDEEFASLVKVLGQEANDMLEISNRSKKMILGWLVSALQKFPDKIFIYRPHPDETTDSYLADLQGEYPNFRIIGDLSIKQWIMISNAIYTWFSTSIAEAFFAGKECLILRPVEIPFAYDVSTYNNARFITNENDFVESLFAKGHESSVDADIIRSYYDYDNTRCAYEKITDLLEKILNTNKYDMQYEVQTKIRIFILLIYNGMLSFFSRKNYRKLFFLFPGIIDRIDRRIQMEERVLKDYAKNYATQEEVNSIIERLKSVGV